MSRRKPCPLSQAHALGIPHLNTDEDPRRLVTFPDYWAACRRHTPGLPADPGEVQRATMEVRAGFQAQCGRAPLDFDALVYPTLAHTLCHFDSNRGSFCWLYKHNLEERIRKHERPLRGPRHGKRVHAESDRLPGDAGRRHPWRPSADFCLYSNLLLDTVLDRLDPTTHAALQFKRMGLSQTDIAGLLGLSAKTAWNRFSVRALGGPVRHHVRRLLLSLPEEERALVALFLLEETDLSPEQVEMLLGVSLEREVDSWKAGERRLADAVELLGLLDTGNLWGHT
jgi:DNA-directed RNA polymerase specialized sigma24 family protein